MLPHARRLVSAVAASLLVGIAATTATAARGAPASDPVASPVMTSAPAPGAAVRHVIAISVDGLNPRALGMLPPGQLPGFTLLAEQGASTRNARTVVEKTQTLPNHTAMVTSRRVALPGGTGVTFNNDNGSTVHASAHGYVPSVFDVVHDHGLRTGLFATKSKFAFLDRSWNAANGARDTTGVDNGADKIDVFRFDDDSATATARMLAQLHGGRPPAFALLHLRDPDSAGHQHGWLSADYLAAVRAADTQVLRVLRAVVRDPGLRGDTVVVVTSDHGGLARDHSDPTLFADYRVPFFVWGTGVRRGADLYALNPRDRRDPRFGQPPYDVRVQPIRNAEIGNVALALLGVRAVPTSQIGRDLGLDVR